MKNNYRVQFFLLAMTLTWFGLKSAKAEPGVTDTKILLGGSIAQSGPVGKEGALVIQGLELFFKGVNESGGIHGRKIEFKALDDEFIPQKSVAITKKLIHEDNVFALIASLGTPNALATLPLVTASGVLFFAPINVADRLRQPVIKNVFNLRMGAYDETRALVKKLKAMGHTKIAIARTSDSLGEVAKGALLFVVRELGIEFSGDGIVAPNTEKIDDAIAVLEKSKPDAIIVWLQGAIGGKFVKVARAKLPKTTEFVGTNPAFNSSFFAAAGEAGEGMLFSLSVPCFSDDSLKITQDYFRLAKVAGIDISQQTYQAYVIAAIFVEALKKSGKELTRTRVISELEKMSEYDFGGIKISFSESDHVGLKQQFIVRSKAGRCVPVL